MGDIFAGCQNPDEMEEDPSFFEPVATPSAGPSTYQQEMGNEGAQFDSDIPQYASDRASFKLDQIIREPDVLLRACRGQLREDVREAIFQGCFNPNMHSVYDIVRYHTAAVSLFMLSPFL